MFATSYSESSGLAGIFLLIELQETHGGRDWTWEKNLREVEIRFGGQDERLGLDA